MRTPGAGRSARGVVPVVTEPVRRGVGVIDDGWRIGPALPIGEANGLVASRCGRVSERERRGPDWRRDRDRTRAGRADRWRDGAALAAVADGDRMRAIEDAVDCHGERIGRRGRDAGRYGLGYAVAIAAVGVGKCCSDQAAQRKERLHGMASTMSGSAIRASGTELTPE